MAPVLKLRELSTLRARCYNVRDRRLSRHFALYKMEPSKRQIRDYAKDSHGRILVDNVEDLPSDLDELVKHLELIKNQGFTSVERDVFVGEYDFAVARLKYYKIREETDGEFELRLKRERERKDINRIREEALAMLTPEQKKALGIY